MDQRWDSDFTIEHSAVVGIARHSGLTGMTAALDAGWDYATFVCDDTVMRLPNDFPLSVPRPRSKLVAVDGILYAAMVYALLKGTQLCAIPDTVKLDATVICEKVGQFLRTLHNLVKDKDPEAFPFDEWTELALGHLGSIDAHSDTPVGDALREMLMHSLPAFDSQQVLRHVDLNDEHVLIYTQSGRAPAVIDQGDAESGPWWFDFTGLWSWGDSKALDAALSVYGRSLSISETVWFQRHTLIVSIGALYYEVCLDPASEATRTWRARLERSMRAAGR